MTEDGGSKISSEDASQTRQRKKRKWDQPAESLASADLAAPGVLPLGNMGPLGVIALPDVAPISASLLTNSLPASYATVPQVLQASSIQHTATIALKPKLQDELIAREIVINDAESSIRYKLTKRQTQEEIQKFTGAVVITRGKYQPPNAPLDGEKPLYLHISAGVHLKDTAERILAVDRAAAMVEEMLRQGHILQPAPSTFHLAMNIGVKALSACVFLGFDPDPSLNIAARIRGPNGQLSCYEVVVQGTLKAHREKKGSNHCIYSCQAIIQKVLKMQSVWLKTYWIQSVQSVARLGFHHVRFIVLFHPHSRFTVLFLLRSSYWLEFRVLGMN